MKIFTLLTLLISLGASADPITPKDVRDHLFASDPAIRAYFETIERERKLDCVIQEDLTTLYSLDENMGFVTSVECFDESHRVNLDYRVHGDAFSSKEFMATRLIIL